MASGRRARVDAEKPAFISLHIYVYVYFSGSGPSAEH